MQRLVSVIFLVICLSILGCERVDQAFEAVEKAKTLKGDIEKTANQVKKDLTGKAEEIKEKALKEVGAAPYLSQKAEKQRRDYEKEKGQAEAGKGE